MTRAANAGGPDDLPTTAANSQQLTKDRSAVAFKNAKRESEARIEAEIDLLIAQHPELIKQAPKALADKLESQQRLRLGFEKEKIADRANLPKASEDTSEGASRRKSTILPGAPADEELRPYNETDKVTVLQLRVVFETIKEIDTRLTQRDQTNTENTRDQKIADGETLRRQELVKKAQELMAKLQLGGNDPAYYQKRLDELDTVLPGAKKAIGDGVTTRVQKRNDADDVHKEAQAYAKRAAEKARDIEQTLETSPADKPFTTIGSSSATDRPDSQTSRASPRRATSRRATTASSIRGRCSSSVVPT